MLLVIDGFNLIYKFPELEMYMYESKLKEARIGLLNLLLRYKKAKPASRLYVFFDGKKDIGNETRADNYEEIKVFYSHENKADDLIKQFIKENLSPGNLHIVTSDKEIHYFSKRYKSKIILSEDFAQKLLDSIEHKPNNEIKSRKESKLSQKEVQYWYEMFTKKGKAN